MDARTLKKELRAEMLLQYQGTFMSRGIDETEEDIASIMQLEIPLSQTEIDRFFRVMDEIVNEALRKAGY